MNILIGERYSDKLLKPLISQGFQVLLAPTNPLVDPRLSGHIDLSAIMPDKNKIVLSHNLTGSEMIVNSFTNAGIEIFNAIYNQNAEYPNDAALCACVCGETLIHNTKITDPAITSQFRGKTIHINQGYANCCICAVNNSSIITSDKGIATKLRTEGFEVLEIEQGLVALDGFDYGFIGGASFKANNTIYFTGRFPANTETIIEEFISRHKMSCVYLTEYQAFDIGGAIVF